MRNRGKTIAKVGIGLLIILVFTSNAQSSDIKKLERKEAIKILEAKGYTNIVIAAIVEGVSVLGTGGTNTAMVAGIAKENGKSVKLGKGKGFELVIYDRQIGWCDFDIELDRNINQYVIFLYTKDGKNVFTHTKGD